jgi:hypothetical protein
MIESCGTAFRIYFMNKPNCFIDTFARNKTGSEFLETFEATSEIF